MRRFLFVLLACLLFTHVAFATIPATTIWEVRLAGSDTNGGGWVSGASGTDMSQFNQANSASSCTTAGTTCYSKTHDLSTADVASSSGSPTHITSATAAFDANIVGNVIYLTGGSLTAGWYEVTTYNSATDVTLDGTAGCAGTCTGATSSIGGALLSTGQASALATGGNVVYVLNPSGTDGGSVYSITNATAGVSGGTVNSSQPVFYVGYSTNRVLGNADPRPSLQLNVSTATMWAANYIHVQNFVLDGNTQTAAKLVSAGVLFVNCLVKNFNTASTSLSVFYKDLATANSATVFVGNLCDKCEAYSNTAIPYNVSYCIDCISSGNSATGFTANALCDHCLAVSNNPDGFDTSSNSAGLIVNSLADDNTTYGFSSNGQGKMFINDAYYGNGTATHFITNLIGNYGAIPITAGEPLTAIGSYNFMPNSTANQGALLLNASDPATFPRGTTSNYRDVGAAQHQVAGSQTGYVF